MRQSTASATSQFIEQAHLRLAELLIAKRRFDWNGELYGVPVARSEQIPDDTIPWSTWLYLGGRGTGKTRSAGERVRHWIKEGRSRLGLIAATAADARDVMIEGESGMLAICHPSDVDFAGNHIGAPIYEPSKRRLRWENGAMATLYSAEEPSRLRGPQHEAMWADELCAWQYPRDTYDMAQFGLRLGHNPQMIITTTPKPSRLLKEIIADKTTQVTRGSTFDNAANLAASFIKRVRSKYEGTSLGNQELYAAILDEAEGALWRSAWIDKARSTEIPELARICVSIDPAVSANEETSNETGIIVCGTTADLETGCVLNDRTGIYSPLGWANQAIDAYYKYQADYILAEVNNGGDLVVQNIKNVDAKIPVRTVHARKGKYLRAEPVAALYEQERIKHIGDLSVLEDQLISWEPLGNYPSPDRLDALVHGLTSLMIRAIPKHMDLVTGPRGDKVRTINPGF